VTFEEFETQGQYADILYRPDYGLELFYACIRKDPANAENHVLAACGFLRNAIAVRFGRPNGNNPVVEAKPVRTVAFDLQSDPFHPVVPVRLLLIGGKYEDVQVATGGERVHVEFTRPEGIMSFSTVITYSSVDPHADEINITWDNLRFSYSCGDQRDQIITEYKKRDFTSVGGPKLAKSTSESALWEPTCESFTRVSSGGTRYYTFAQLNRGDGACPEHTYEWALIAPPLRAPIVALYGLNRWVDVIQQLGYRKPAVNSVYRGPLRHFSRATNAAGKFRCGAASTSLSAHLLGSAVDLRTPATAVTPQQKEYVVKRWLRAAKLQAKARFVEWEPRFPCVPNWSCAHADWQTKELQAYGPQGRNSAKWLELWKPNSPPPLPPPPAASTVAVASDLQALAASADWRTRARAFAAQALDLAPEAARPSADAARTAASRRDIGPRNRGLLAGLLERELGDPANAGEDEDRTEFLLDLVAANGLYGGAEAAPLLMDRRVVTSGNEAYTAAARLGDTAVPMLAAKARDQAAEEYPDLVGVACRMRELGTVAQNANLAQVDRVILAATRAKDELVRAFAARCLAHLPQAEGLSRLQALASDPHRLVRSEAQDTLRRMKQANPAR
jgi:hypothetical protein